KRGKTSNKLSVSILKQELDRIDEDYADDTQYDEATSDAVDTASLLFSEPTENELALLRRLRQWAEKESAQRDSKVKCMMDWLNKEIRQNKKWSNDWVILFTEYRATQKWLMEILAQEGFTGGDRLLTMYGGMDLGTGGTRENIKNAFQASPKIS